MQQELAATAETAAKAAASSSSGGTASTEDRLTARIANLGWDDAIEQLVLLPREILALAKIDSTTHGPVVPITNRVGVGSAVEVHFKTQADLAAARVAVRALRKEYAAGRTVWLDRWQSAAEAAAAKAVHRLADALKDIEQEKSQPAAVAKDMPSRSVLVSQTRIAFVSSGEVHRTAAGTHRCGEPSVRSRRRWRQPCHGRDQTPQWRLRSSMQGGVSDPPLSSQPGLLHWKSAGRL